MTKKNVPSLRYKEFTDTWELRKLGEFVSITTGKLDANAMVENGKYDFYTSGIQKYRINVPAFQGPAITIAGNGATVGYMHLADGDFNAYQRTYVLTNFLADRKFLFYEINNKLPSKIKLEARTGSIPYIVIDMLTDLKISVPKKEEQMKVGDFLSTLEATISLNQRKLYKLKQLKKSLLQELFPKEDSSKPQLQLKNYSNSWQKKKLFEVLYVNSGKDYKHLGKGNIPVYGTGGYMLSVDDKLSEKDSIGIGRKGTIDKPQYLKAPFWTVDTLFFLTPFENQDVYFLFSMLQRINWKKMDESTGVPSLSKDAIEKIEETIPSLEEQIEIGNFFYQLDQTITVQQRKYEKFKQIKTALLQEMFV